MNGKLLRIVPAKSNDPKATAHLCQGTQVFAGDVKVKGVCKVTLTAETGDGVWRALIECFVEPPDELLADGVVVKQAEG